MLSVSDLSCVRGDKRLFSGVSFSLQAGEWLHLQGDNGTGKTSLLRIVCGLAHAHKGHISWKGKLVEADQDAFRADLAYLGHNLALKEELSALENLLSDAAVAGRPLALELAMQALSHLGLRGREHLPVRVLSQGQKRRAALARLQSCPAKLWVLDEPFVALDKRAQEVLAEIVSTHIAAGGLALFTSHQPVQLAGTGNVYRLTS